MFREEDEDDVEELVEMTVMAEKDKGDSSSDFSKSGQEASHRDLAADTHTSLTKVILVKQRCQKEIVDLTLHNRFNLLSTRVTCEKMKSSQFSDLGQAQMSYNIDQS